MVNNSEQRQKHRMIQLHKIAHMRRRTVASLLMLCCLLAVLPVSATEDKLDQVQEDIQKLEQEQQENEEFLEELESDQAYLDGRLKELNTQLTQISAGLTDLESQLIQKETELLETAQELEEVQLEEQQQYEDMKKRIQFLYERGGDSLLTSLLEAENFTDLINFGQYTESLYRYDRQMLVEYQATCEDVKSREAQLQQEQQELLALRQEQEEQRQQVQDVLAQIQQQSQENQQSVAAIQAEQAAAEEQLRMQLAYEEELEAQKAAEDAAHLEAIKQQEEENLAPPVISTSTDDLALLAAIIECEAGGESYEGKLAVGSVVMNRVRSSHFPNTIMEVIYQNRQFTPVASGRFATVLARGASESCYQAARENLSGVLTLDCLFFRRNNGTIPGIVIGNHVFY